MKIALLTFLLAATGATSALAVTAPRTAPMTTTPDTAPNPQDPSGPEQVWIVPYRWN